MNQMLRKAMVSGLFVSIGTELDAEEDFPPGASDYRSAFCARVFPEDLDDEALEQVAMSEGVREEDGALIIPVGHGHFVLCDLQVSSQDIWEALDAREGDLETVGSLVLDLDNDGLSEDLPIDIEPFMGGFIIVNNVEINPAWTGAKLGLLGTALALRHWSFGCGLAALYPMKPGAKGIERDTSSAALAKYWGQLGFVELSGNVFVAPVDRHRMDAFIAKMMNSAR